MNDEEDQISTELPGAAAHDPDDKTDPLTKNVRHRGLLILVGSGMSQTRPLHPNARTCLALSHRAITRSDSNHLNSVRASSNVLHN